MAEGNFYIENPANKSMHYGNDPIVGIIPSVQKAPSKKLYTYSEGEKLYNDIGHDIWVESNKAKPKKKGIPLIIKISAGILALGAIIFGGVKGIKGIFKKFKP